MNRLRKRAAAVALALAAAPLGWGGLSLEAAAEEAPQVSAKSAIVITGDTGAVLYEKDAHTSRPMASTTKIMTALLALEAAEYLGDPAVSITQEMAEVEGSSMGLAPGDEITLGNLAAGMLLASGNDAANAVALYLDGSLEAFAERMNARAEKLGLADTYFVTPSGLDGVSPDGREHASSAYDMAMLAREALGNQAFREICASSQFPVAFENPEKEIAFTNHNRLLAEYPGCIGVKTGYTKAAGRCLVSAAQRDGALLIAVTLCAPDDWADHKSLLDYGFSQVERCRLEAQGVPRALPIVGGEAQQVPVAGGQDAWVTLPLGQGQQALCRVCCPKFVYAPVAAGEQLGEIRWYVEGQVVCSQPLYAAETVPAGEGGSLWQRLLGGAR